jgi:hypothetical protein
MTLAPTSLWSLPDARWDSGTRTAIRPRGSRSGSDEGPVHTWGREP